MHELRVTILTYSGNSPLLLPPSAHKAVMLHTYGGIGVWPVKSNRCQYIISFVTLPNAVPSMAVLVTGKARCNKKV